MSEPLRLLIVEDCEDDALLVERALARAGFAPETRRLQTAGELDAALAECAWDAVISDFSLPRFSAPEALAVVQRSGRDIPFLVVSGTMGEDAAVAMMRAGAHDYLMKDELGRLPEALRRELREARVRAERVADDAQRRRLEEQLAQSLKMEAVGRLAGGVAHDLNNMLVPILCYAQMIRDSVRPGDQLHADAQEIVRAAERARDLVRQLLAFARRQTLELRPLQLNTVISGFETMLRRTLRENVVLELRLAPDLPLIDADPGQIELVLLNLGVNAQDAMPDGGTLVIATALTELGEDQAVQHPGMQPGPHVALTVSDTGVGMDAATLARAFEPFFTTKPLGEGTGLGLSTVHGIVTQHGGAITVSSEPGKGSAFRSCFPLSHGAARTSAPGIVSDQQARGSETILLVEDQPLVREVAAKMLRERGYAVHEAADGASAFAAAAQAGPMHLLVTDAVLPDSDGRSIYRRLAEGRPELRVLFMSGYAGDVIGRHGVVDAGVHFIQKPFTVRDFVARVRAVLDGPPGEA